MAVPGPVFLAAGAVRFHPIGATGHRLAFRGEHTGSHGSGHGWRAVAFRRQSGPAGKLFAGADSMSTTSTRPKPTLPNSTYLRSFSRAYPKNIRTHSSCS